VSGGPGARATAAALRQRGRRRVLRRPAGLSRRRLSDRPDPAPEWWMGHGLNGAGAVRGSRARPELDDERLARRPRSSAGKMIVEKARRRSTAPVIATPPYRTAPRTEKGAG